MNGNYIPFPFRFLHWKRHLHPDSNEKKYKHCHRSDPFQGQGDLALRYLGFGAKASHEELQSCETLLKMSLTEAGGIGNGQLKIGVQKLVMAGLGGGSPNSYRITWDWWMRSHEITMAVSEQPNLARYLDLDPWICGFLSFVVEIPSLEVTDNMQWSKNGPMLPMLFILWDCK